MYSGRFTDFVSLQELSSAMNIKAVGSSKTLVTKHQIKA